MTARRYAPLAAHRPRLRAGLFPALLGFGGLLLAGGPLAAHEGPHSEGAEPASPVAEAFGEADAPDGADPFPPGAVVVESTRPAAGCPVLLDYRVADLRGRLIDLCAFSGRVLLVVNTASRCGFTPQYKGLEALYETYRDRGLVVMGFPSNDFGGQEPGTNEEIGQFCESRYGVRFPLFTKVRVRGPEKIPFFGALTAVATEGARPGEIGWNFEKFLIGRDGRLIARFPTRVEPGSPAVVAALEQALAAAR